MIYFAYLPRQNLKMLPLSRMTQIEHSLLAPLPPPTLSPSPPPPNRAARLQLLGVVEAGGARGRRRCDAALGSARPRGAQRRCGACPKGVRGRRGMRPGGAPRRSARRRAGRPGGVLLRSTWSVFLQMSEVKTWSVAWRRLELALVWVLGLCWRRPSFGVWSIYFIWPILCNGFLFWIPIVGVSIFFWVQTFRNSHATLQELGVKSMQHHFSSSLFKNRLAEQINLYSLDSGIRSCFSIEETSRDKKKRKQL